MNAPQPRLTPCQSELEYDYAATLLAYGKSAREVMGELTRGGLDATTAFHMVESLSEVARKDAARSTIAKPALVAAMWLIGGALALATQLYGLAAAVAVTGLAHGVWVASGRAHGSPRRSSASEYEPPNLSILT